VRLEVGDLVVIPKGEWHGFANDTDEPTLVVTVMGGVATTPRQATRSTRTSLRER
jgi:quercetin dioxygenase-like cupin family protein